MGFAQTVVGMEPPPIRVKKLCGQCHSTMINDDCISGHCDKKPLIHSEARDWLQSVEYMVRVFGCKMTPDEQKNVVAYLEKNYPGKVYPLTWTKVFTADQKSGWNVVSLKEWKGHLYMGTEGGGRIFRSGNGLEWKEVAATGHDKVYGLIPFKEYLYAGTFDPEPQIWRSSDGQTWKQVGLLPFQQKGVTAFGVFNGNLYAGTAASEIYRSKDGKEWERVVALKNKVQPSWSLWIRFITIFKGVMFVGLEGGEMYSSEDGLSWSQVLLSLDGGTGLRGAGVFNQELFVGTTNTGEIWNTGDGKKWKKVFSPETKKGYVASMVVFNHALYASINRLIVRTMDGLHWEEVGEVGFKTVEAMTNFKNFLYLGIDSPPEAQIFRTSGLSPSQRLVPFEEVTKLGSVQGSLKDLHTGFFLYQTLEESPIEETSGLDHVWKFRNPGGKRFLLVIRGYHPKTTVGEEFVFSYSVDNREYKEMFSLKATREDWNYQFFELPKLQKGNIFIRVRDANRNNEPPLKNKILIDHLYILVEG
jgi:hypothetical protein